MSEETKGARLTPKEALEKLEKFMVEFKHDGYSLETTIRLVPLFPPTVKEETNEAAGPDKEEKK